MRTRVHEYGGHAYTVADGVVYFSHFADQRLYRQDPDSQAHPITPATALRYADYVVDRRRDLLFCVREDHTGAGEAVNTLVKVRCGGDDDGGEVIVAGNNFYSSPRLSPDGARLAWLTWNHPNMPWDGTELWVGDLDADGAIVRATCVAGGPAESIFQPEWSPDGLLYFISDRTGWWNLYRQQDGRTEALCPHGSGIRPATVGLWHVHLCLCIARGVSSAPMPSRVSPIWPRLDTVTLALEEIPTPYTDLNSVRVGERRRTVHWRFGDRIEARSACSIWTPSGSKYCSAKVRFSADPRYTSTPRAIEFPTEGGLTAYGFYYPPHNQDFSAPQGEKPPLLVKSHGGPTGATTSVFDLRVQYWTSRGIAVLDVNYGGSTGYGRAYRQRLNDQWGIVDVDDCVNGARYLVELGEVDGERLMITGGSAGGYTTLCALTFRQLLQGRRQPLRHRRPRSHGQGDPQI